MIRILSITALFLSITALFAFLSGLGYVMARFTAEHAEKPTEGELAHSCATCKHGNKEWDELPCDACTGADDKWEAL